MKTTFKKKFITLVVTTIVIGIFFYCDYEFRLQIGRLLEINTVIQFLSSMWNYIVFLFIVLSIIKVIDKGEL